MTRKLQSILVTGGAGFIGSNFIRFLLNNNQFDGRIINLDALTYAGNRSNLADIEKQFGKTRYHFIHGNICDSELTHNVFMSHNIDTVVHFAAESHVDRSICGPKDFLETNVIGTFNLLQTARTSWNNRSDVLFHHVSTDEVYGSLGKEGFFFENSAYDPRSPYSASKASSDHFVRAYFHTYGLPITISNCSNNYGPYQFPEKLIPLMIDKIINEESLPVYGDGKNIRDWLHVYDHNQALWTIIRNGECGDVYNIGGEAEMTNIDLVNLLCEEIATHHGKDSNYYKHLVTFVKDRPGHDKRYAINCDKLKRTLDWQQSFGFAEGLKQTVDWYLNNREWTQNIKNGNYKQWIAENYSWK